MHIFYIIQTKAAKVILKLWDKHDNRTADMVVIEGPKAGGHLGFHTDKLETEQENFDKTIVNIIDEVKKYREKYSVLQVGTGDSPLTIPFYEKCGFTRSHSIKNFFTDNYNHPIYECGIQLVDMIYLQRKL